jgi:hypothetical protein
MLTLDFDFETTLAFPTAELPLVTVVLVLLLVVGAACASVALDATLIAGTAAAVVAATVAACCDIKLQAIRLKHNEYYILESSDMCQSSHLTKTNL